MICAGSSLRIQAMPRFLGSFVSKNGRRGPCRCQLHERCQTATWDAQTRFAFEGLNRGLETTQQDVSVRESQLCSPLGARVLSKRVVSSMLFGFGPFELDLATCELRRAGESVPLQPRVFGTLRYLIEHRDRVVGKQELNA